MTVAPVVSAANPWIGSSKGTRGVRWGVARSILIAWVFTIPATMLVGAASWYVLNAINLR